MNADKESSLEPDRPSPLAVLRIRLVGVFRLVLRGDFRHLAGYVVNFFYRRKYPDDPWLSRPANLILDSFLKKSDVGLEFGSGRSTVWFAERISRLTSIEHNPVWQDKVAKEPALRGLLNVDYLLVEKDVDDGRGQDSAYVRTTHRFSKNSFDFILVDGTYRDSCALVWLELLRPGGILIIDDARWFLPRHLASSGPGTSVQVPASPQWAEFEDAIADRRIIRTTDGIHDTTLCLKPWK